MAPISTRLQVSDLPATFVPGRWRIVALFAICLLILVIAFLLGVAIGAIYIPPFAILEITVARLLAYPTLYPDTWATILFDVRLPRVALTALIGAALAASGSTYQGLFRNPLADPYLVGVASGAGLGATFAIALNLPATLLGLNAIPIAAFVGAILTVTIVVFSAQVGRTTPVSTMLLAGVAIGAFATALTTLIMLRSPDGIRRAFSWMLGGYNGGGWQPFLVVLPYLIIGLVVLQIHARAINVFQLDEEQARQLGLNVEQLKITLVTAATLMTAPAVAFGGLVGFVGLIVPHILRLLGGHDYRRLIPLSAIGGAAFLIVADMLARVVIAPAELPVGVITALAGAPFFVFLLRRLKRSVF
jgi:iron complex transport system permease protein